jgi:tRNA(fMet)-specific endonuclease VapC
LTYLVDTDWIIDHFNLVPAVTQKLHELLPAGLVISIITLAELYEGVYFSRDPDKSLLVLERFLINVPVLPLDTEICRLFGQERGRLRSLGALIGDFDLLIAVTAKVHHLTLCTNNRTHFERIEGLRIISVNR